MMGLMSGSMSARCVRVGPLRSMLPVRWIPQPLGMATVARGARLTRRAAQPSTELVDTSTSGKEAGSASKAQGEAAAATGGTVLGAVALITGSSVGAGILALPEVSAPAGFFPTSAALVLCWALLSLEALVIAEVNVAVGRKNGSDGEYIPTTLTQTTEETLGTSGAAIATGAYMMTSYTLIVAYLCKGSQVVEGLFGGDLGLSQQACGALFAAVLCSVLCTGDEGRLDRLNQALTSLLLAAFGYIVIGGSGAANFSSLGDTANWSAVPTAVPVLFLSLVYHDLVPVVCTYLDGDLPKIRKAILMGGTLPLAMFLAWNSVALSLVGPEGSSADPLELLNGLGLPCMSGVVASFGLLAITTSFMGTFLGLSTYLQIQVSSLVAQMTEKAPMDKPAAAGPLPLRELSYFLTLAPPLFIYWHNSDSFLPAAEFAGAYGMTTLYALMPPLMALRLMSPPSESREEAEEGFSVFGPAGRVVLASMTSAAVGIESVKVALDSGISLDQFLDLSLPSSPSASLALPELANLFDSLPRL